MRAPRRRATTRRRGDGLGVEQPLVLLLGVTLCLLSSACGDDGEGRDLFVGDIGVDVSNVGEPINRQLLAIHDFPSPSVTERIAATGLAATIVRGVASRGDGLRYDCESEAFDAASLDQWYAWMGGIDAALFLHAPGSGPTPVLEP